jgi:hypothetical protein
LLVRRVVTEFSIEISALIELISKIFGAKANAICASDMLIV